MNLGVIRMKIYDNHAIILYIADVVKLVDTYASGAYAARLGGSSPFIGTNSEI